MPITILDLILLAVMLISGLLAMVRGFMREILSIAAWGAAALVTLYAYSKLLPTAKTYFNNDTVASIVVVAGVFVATLIVVSIITVRISDMILDSRIGALDRTLGFLFGLARGLLAAMLQSMQSQRGDGGGFRMTEDAEHAALLAQRVAFQVILQVNIGRVRIARVEAQIALCGFIGRALYHVHRASLLA